VQSLARRLANATLVPRPDRPIPVALVITDLDVGGAERAMTALATGLDRRRWTPTVICLDRSGPLWDVLRHEGIATICLDAERRRPLSTLSRLRRALRSVKPALAQSFLFHANVATKLVAASAGVRYVVGGIRVAERRANAHLRLDRWTQRLSAGSVCVSEGVRRFSVEIGGIDPERLIVIANGIDPAPFVACEPSDRRDFGIPEGAPVALFVGRLDPQKGVDTLLDAVEIVRKERPEARLILVGDGPERAECESRAAGWPDSVHVLGRRDDVPSLLALGDLLILPSRWEGMPNVVLEAMAASRAVIGTDIEGTNELVLPGATGWLVPPDDPRALASAWLDAIRDPARLRRFGHAGRIRVEAQFTPEQVVSQYDALWTQLLGFAS
jgi:starch synthase (maltosyl-transferring)